MRKEKRKSAPDQSLHRYHGLMRQVRYRILGVSVLYFLLLVMVLGVGYVLGNSVIWYGTEYWYPLLRWMSDHVFLTWLLFYLVGEICILVFYLYKITSWIEQINQSMELISEEGNLRIRLPQELYETENRMNEIKDRIRQSRYEAKEAHQRKNDLVVYLAHDLKTPLTSVMGYLALLLEEPQLSAETRQKYLDIVERKAERLEQLINEFFEITRFNLTTMELEKSSVPFGRLLEQTVFEFQPMLQPKNMTCRLEAPRDVVVYCDADKMQRVVDNLLRNGILYGYEGSQITLTLAEEGDRAVLTCKNRGPTIPQDKLERIFEQFYRLDSARTSSTGGSGLGLAIARQIVRLHGGTISAQSHDEVTTFRVELPMAQNKGTSG